MGKYLRWHQAWSRMTWRKDVFGTYIVQHVLWCNHLHYSKQHRRSRRGNVSSVRKACGQLQNFNLWYGVCQWFNLGGCLMGRLEGHVIITGWKVSAVGPAHQLSTKTTKTIAVLQSSNSVREQFPRPEATTLRLNSDPVEVVSNSEYFGSTMSDDCSLSAEAEARISKASGTFSSLTRILWYQHKSWQQTKIHLSNSILVPVLTYGLLSAAFSMPHKNRLQSFVTRWLKIMFDISLQEEKRSTEIHKVAKQSRMLPVLVRKRLCSVEHIERIKDEHVLKKLLVCALNIWCSDKGPNMWFTPVLAIEGFTEELMEAGHCSVDRKAQCRRGHIERQVQFCGHSRLWLPSMYLANCEQVWSCPTPKVVPQHPKTYLMPILWPGDKTSRSAQPQGVLHSKASGELRNWI